MRWASVLILLGATPALAQRADPPPDGTATLASSAREPEMVGAAIAPARPAEEPPHIAQEPQPFEGAIDPDSYVVGPGDKLTIDLWGLRDESRTAQVTPEGKLLVPSIGPIDARGRTLAAVQKAVTEKLHAVYPRLRGSVTLAEPRTFLVHVTGAVAHPGTYSATALTRVSALIPRAGGVLPSGSSRTVEIRRKGSQKPIEADLVRFSLLGRLDGDPTVLDGDTLYVPPRQCTVEITGAVRRPGRYELTDQRNLGALLALAGGTSAQTARGLPLRVTARGQGDERVVRSVREGASVELHDGDQVHVPELDDLRQVVVVQGAVVGPPGAQAQREGVTDNHADAPFSAPRDVSVPIPFVDGDGVRDLVTKVRGLEPWADGRNAFVLRPQSSGPPRRIPVDVPAIVSGQAPELAIRAGDTLEIPSRRQAVLVSGAVVRPGLYQSNPELHPLDYVHLAGGATKNGSEGSARVITSGGVTHKLAKSGAIEPGDTITVPETRLSTADIVTISLVLSNLAVGVTAVVLTAVR